MGKKEGGVRVAGRRGHANAPGGLQGLPGLASPVGVKLTSN